jgi:hypothetical protein
MHEFHAWIGLSESTEESDLGGLQDAVGELQELAADSKWHDAVFEVRNLNGQFFMTAEGMVNRRREEGERLDLFLAIIARKLPGSWGLIYERDDEMPNPPGPNAFRVRVLARGSVVERTDPFLSPCNPVIEDLRVSPPVTYRSSPTCALPGCLNRMSPRSVSIGHRSYLRSVFASGARWHGGTLWQAVASPSPGFNR